MLPESQISTEPKHHPDCCLSISTTLLDYLARLLPKSPATILSIGSGSGLLEQLLSSRYPSLDVLGVEVDNSVNKYLPEQNVYIVKGTWESCTLAASAEAWILVYPRQPQLLAKYLNEYSAGAAVTIIWLGPRIDWIDYEFELLRHGFSQITVQDNCGLVSYEMMAVARKSLAGVEP